MFFLYNDEQMHNYFTNYHTPPTCFDTTVSSSGSSELVPCQITQVRQMQLLVKQFHSTLHTRHSHGITSTKCRINTVVSPDDGHTVAQNMWRKEINILRNTVHQIVIIYKIINKDVGQQNIKIQCYTFRSGKFISS